MKYIESKQKADVCYGNIPKVLVKDMNGQSAMVIEVRPEDNGKVMLQKCIDECFEDNESGSHYTISHRKMDQKIIEQTEHYACVVVCYNVKDMY